MLFRVLGAICGSFFRQHKNDPRIALSPRSNTKGVELDSWAKPLILKNVMKRTLSSGLILLLLMSAIALTACNPSGQNSSNSPPPPAPSPKKGFEADLEWVKKGQYTYVWVFSRKDGKPIDKDDAAYLRENAPQVVDWVTTDEGKKVIAGTNFNLVEGNLGLLQQRFNAEDYSAR